MAVPPLENHRQAGRASDVWVALPPDPAVLKALGGGHTLETAIADIVDNSLDALASRVRIRFITEGSALLAIQIRDDGNGMDQDELIRALRLGNRRDYGADELGHFGIGLKAASMRHAEILRVYSSTVDQERQTFAAIEMSSSGNDSEIGVRILRPSHAETGYLYGYESEQVTSGTVIEWSDIIVSSKAASADVQQDWLERTIDSVRRTLGLAFHRRIESGSTRLEIDVFDVAVEAAGVARRVEPVDPFHYLVPGRKGFPVQLTGRTATGLPVTATCHILPPRGHDKLPGKREDWQGIYVYRNDRLLTLNGGWQGLVLPTRDLQLARVEVELRDDLLDTIRPTPEKNDVSLTPDYAHALELARTHDKTIGFRDYIDQAIDSWKTSNQRNRDKPITRIAGGLPEELIAQLGDNFGWRPNQEPVSIEWRELDKNDLFKIDLTGRALALNTSYAEQIGGGQATAATNLFATLLYLLTESYFIRSSHHSSTQDYLEQVDTALIAALAAGKGDDSGPLEGRSPSTIPADAFAALLAASSKAMETHSELEYNVNRKVPPVPFQGAAPPVESKVMGEAGTEIASNSDPEHARLVSTQPASPTLTTLEPIDPTNVDPEVISPDRQRAAFSSATVNDPLTLVDLEAFESYTSGNSVAEAAGQLARTEDDVARSLVWALFGEEATADDDGVASHQGLAYTPRDREKILLLYKQSTHSGQAILEIARAVGRTPLSIARFLLDSPTRPVSTDKRIRKNVRRRVRPTEGPPLHNAARVAFTDLSALASNLWGTLAVGVGPAHLPIISEALSPPEWMPSNPLAAVKQLLSDLPGFETNVTIKVPGRGRPPEIDAEFTGQNGRVAIETITSWSPTSADLTTHRLRRVLTNQEFSAALLVVVPSLADQVASTIHEGRVFVISTEQLPGLATILLAQYGE
ncbi:ATP-binding protein [Pseudoclavibacter helvolus]|uniref:ATP-binding protein n=1 Tax=Pseudoclavibacter helvolus TaxID=255205 RepID=UPI0009EEB87A|nr:ATP-binding protein [Pseudoclavibacter helvolus]